MISVTCNRCFVYNEINYYCNEIQIQLSNTEINTYYVTLCSCLMSYLPLKFCLNVCLCSSFHRLTWSLSLYRYVCMYVSYIYHLGSACTEREWKHSGASLFLDQISEGVQREYVCPLGPPPSSPCRPDCVSIQSQETVWSFRAALLWGNALHAGLTSRAKAQNTTQAVSQPTPLLHQPGFKWPKHTQTWFYYY